MVNNLYACKTPSLLVKFNCFFNSSCTKICDTKHFLYILTCTYLETLNVKHILVRIPSTVPSIARKIVCFYLLDLFHIPKNLLHFYDDFRVNIHSKDEFKIFSQGL